MTPAARVQASIQILDLIIAAVREQGAAADTIIADWFKTRRFAGSSDRRAVRDHVYRAIRAFGDIPVTGRSAMIGLAADDPVLASLFDGSTHAPAVVGAGECGATPSLLPEPLAALICAGEVPALLDRAPFDLRVNTLRTSREHVMPMLPGAEIITATSSGLRLPDKIPLANRPELRGLVEVQDAGSQIIADICAAQPGQTVIDLCAGAGGKALALAAAMGNMGELLACDTDRRRLGQLPARTSAAAATIVEPYLLNPRQELAMLTDWHRRADLVLVDAPCSGSGTWRRNPEARWRLTAALVERLAREQRRLLALASELVAPGGRLVYAVCALTYAEGAGVVDEFLGQHPEWQAVNLHQSGLLATGFGRAVGAGIMLTPAHDGCDGFFFARLQAAL